MVALLFSAIYYFFFFFFFFFNDTATTEIYTLSLHDALPISTKPKPRERPVSRSVITAADITSPKRANAPRRPSLEVENERPPTNSFTDMTCSFRLPGRIPPSIPVRLLQRSSTRNAGQERHARLSAGRRRRLRRVDRAGAQPSRARRDR